MYQHIDLLAAQSMARERERTLQRELARRGSRPDQVQGHAVTRAELGRLSWLDQLLVRAHLRATHAR